MTRPRSPEHPVRCPNCLQRVAWSTADAVTFDEDRREQPFPPRQPREDETQFAARTHRAVRVCPGPGDRHYVPYHYADFGDPILIGLVGSTHVGKSVLLTAMIGRLLDAPWLDRLGIALQPLDSTLHQRFSASHLEPLLRHRRKLDATPIGGSSVEFTYATTLHYRDGRRPVALGFFDVSGERLQDPDAHNAFLSIASALIFVVDATQLGGDWQGRGRAVPGDRTFQLALDRISARFAHLNGAFPDPFLPVPTAIVISKADRLVWDRDDPVRRWFADHDDDLDLGTVEEESADVFAFLTSRGAGAYLAPAMRCAPVTLHYASATNCPVDEDGHFPDRSFRQVRVLKPLLALLANIGVLDRARIGGLDG